MTLAGLVGFFRLSPLGQTIFRDAGLKDVWFEALVVEEGDRGLLVKLLDEPEPAMRQAYMVLLVKWEYIATVRFRYDV